MLTAQLRPAGPHWFTIQVKAGNRRVDLARYGTGRCPGWRRFTPMRTRCCRDPRTTVAMTILATRGWTAVDTAHDDREADDGLTLDVRVRWTCPQCGGLAVVADPAATGVVDDHTGFGCADPVCGWAGERRELLPTDHDGDYTDPAATSGAMVRAGGGVR